MNNKTISAPHTEKFLCSFLEILASVNPSSSLKNWRKSHFDNIHPQVFFAVLSFLPSGLKPADGKVLRHLQNLTNAIISEHSLDIKKNIHYHIVSSDVPEAMIVLERRKNKADIFISSAALTLQNDQLKALLTHELTELAFLDTKMHPHEREFLADGAGGGYGENADAMIAVLRNIRNANRLRWQYLKEKHPLYKDVNAQCKEGALLLYMIRHMQITELYDQSKESDPSLSHPNYKDRIAYLKELQAYGQSSSLNK
jgi:hypothetical protein